MGQIRSASRSLSSSPLQNVVDPRRHGCHRPVTQEDPGPLPAKGLSGTRSGQHLKQQIPIRTDNRDIDRPGFLEVDTVAHCGTSMAGSFIWSLTFTDIFSQWTENRAVWNKGATDVLAQVKDLEQGLAFALEGFDVDNGSEFLTFHLWRYLLDRPRPVPMTRSRAYQRL